MGKVANTRGVSAPDLPGHAASGSHSPPGDTTEGDPAHAGAAQAAAPPDLTLLPATAPLRATTGTLSPGLTVAEVLELSTLVDARLLAGGSGLDRVVQRLNVMEVPDILGWVKPHELLLTTGYPLRHTPETLGGLVTELDERGLAAIAVKLGRYLDGLPAEMLETADRLGFPLIRLPDDAGFDDILNQVLTDILNRQAGLLARSEEAHRALVQVVLAGGGLAEVADELVGLLDGAVFVTATDGRVLARSGLAEDLRAVERAAADGAGRLTGLDSPYGVGTREGLDGTLCVVPVVAGSLDHGRIALFAHRRLRPEDMHVLERAATVAALVVTRELAVSAVEHRYQADFLRDLLTGREGDLAWAVRQARALEWELERPLLVLVAEPERPAEAAEGRPETELLSMHERLAGSWRSAVRSKDRQAAACGFSREVVAVVGAPSDGDALRLAREVAAGLSADPATPRCAVTVGVSRTVDGADGLPAAYEQARTAVRVGRRLHGPGGVAAFDGLGVYRLLSLVPDGAELTAFAAETLGELAAGGDAETAELRRTLQVLLETNLNVAEASRRLFLHYNTLRYRIGKLERMVGPFTADPHLRLSLSLALLVVQMRGL